MASMVGGVGCRNGLEMSVVSDLIWATDCVAVRLRHAAAADRGMELNVSANYFGEHTAVGSGRHRQPAVVYYSKGYGAATSGKFCVPEFKSGAKRVSFADSSQ